MNAVILFSSGLVLCFVVAKLADIAIFNGSVNAFDDAQYSQWHTAMDIIRPIVLSVIIFGGGMAITAFVSHSVLCDVLSVVWFCALAHVACLRGPSIETHIAVRSMLHTMAAISVAYWLLV